MTQAILERSIQIKSGVFSEDVIDDRGRVDLKKLAEALNLTMPTIAAALGRKTRALNNNPTSKNAQSGAIMLLSTMNDLAEYAKSKKLALNFLVSMQPGLENKTPVDLLKAGKLQRLCSFVDDAITLRPD